MQSPVKPAYIQQHARLIQQTERTSKETKTYNERFTSSCVVSNIVLSDPAITVLHKYPI